MDLQKRLKEDIKSLQVKIEQTLLLKKILQQEIPLKVYRLLIKNFYETKILWKEFCSFLYMIHNIEQQYKMIHLASNTFNRLYQWMEIGVYSNE